MDDEKKMNVIDALVDVTPAGVQFCEADATQSSTDEQDDHLDQTCRSHKTISRREADRIRAKKAFSRVLSDDAPDDEKAIALLTACCMVSKINYEKFFSRIKKTLKKSSKKTKDFKKIGKRIKKTTQNE